MITILQLNTSATTTRDRNDRDKQTWKGSSCFLWWLLLLFYFNVIFDIFHHNTHCKTGFAIMVTSIIFTRNFVSLFNVKTWFPGECDPFYDFLFSFCSNWYTLWLMCNNSCFWLILVHSLSLWLVWIVVWFGDDSALVIVIFRVSSSVFSIVKTLDNDCHSHDEKTHMTLYDKDDSQRFDRMIQRRRWGEKMTSLSPRLFSSFSTPSSNKFIHEVTLSFVISILNHTTSQTTTFLEMRSWGSHWRKEVANEEKTSLEMSRRRRVSYFSKKVCEGELHCFWNKFQEKIDDHIKQKESKKKKEEK